MNLENPKISFEAKVFLDIPPSFCHIIYKAIMPNKVYRQGIYGDGMRKHTGISYFVRGNE